MWKDPIVEEIRQARREYAASLSSDPDKIFEDIKKKQAKSSKKLINNHLQSRWFVGSAP